MLQIPRNIQSNVSTEDKITEQRKHNDQIQNRPLDPRQYKSDYHDLNLYSSPKLDRNIVEICVGTIQQTFMQLDGAHIVLVTDAEERYAAFIEGKMFLKLGEKVKLLFIDAAGECRMMLQTVTEEEDENSPEE